MDLQQFQKSSANHQQGISEDAVDAAEVLPQAVICDGTGAQVYDVATAAASVPKGPIIKTQTPDARARATFWRDTAATTCIHESAGGAHPTMVPHTAMLAAHDPEHGLNGPISAHRIAAVQVPHARYSHTLATFVRNKGVTLHGVYDILGDVLVALRTGKEAGIAHGNLSMHAIHMNDKGRAVVAGLEAAYIARVPAPAPLGDRLFLPPEALALERPGVGELDPYAADMWALGFLLLHLLFPISLPALMSHSTVAEDLARGRVPGVLLQLMDQTPEFLLTTQVHRLAVATMVTRLTVSNPTRRGTIEEMQQLVVMGRAELGAWRVRDGLPGDLSDADAGEVMPWDVTWRTYDELYSFMIDDMMRLAATAAGGREAVEKGGPPAAARHLGAQAIHSPDESAASAASPYDHVPGLPAALIEAGLARDAAAQPSARLGPGNPAAHPEGMMGLSRRAELPGNPAGSGGTLREPALRHPALQRRRSDGRDPLSNLYGGHLAAEVLADRQAPVRIQCRLWASGCGQEDPPAPPPPLPAAMVVEMLAARPVYLRNVRCRVGSTCAAAAPLVIDLCDSPDSVPQARVCKRGCGEATAEGVYSDAAEPPAKRRSQAP